MKVLVLERQDLPLGIGGDADPMDLLARMIGGHQMLVPILDPLHRPPQPQGGEADQDVLRIELAANPESASDMSLEQVNGGGAAPEGERQQVAGAMRHLGGAMQLEDIADGVVARDRAARFQRHAGMATDLELKRDDLMGSPKGGFDIAVGLADDRGLGQEARLEFPRRMIRGQDHRQILDLEGDQIRRIFRQIGALGEHGRDRLADITDMVARQDRLAIRRKLLDPAFPEVDRRNVGDVIGGPDAHDPRRRQGGGDIDRA